jgi:hypothetical protein
VLDAIAATAAPKSVRAEVGKSRTGRIYLSDFGIDRAQARQEAGGDL